VEVPYLGIRKADPEKRQFVYCISHSRWNDGFSSQARHDFFTYNKRSVIELGVNWVQIRDQNPLLSKSPYGRPARAEEFRDYFWMRDSEDSAIRFLWDRTLVSTRPDPSDAGMAYFLVTGDEECTPEKLRRLLVDKTRPEPVAERDVIRLEAENFRSLAGCELEHRNDRLASHRMNVRLARQTSGTLTTRVAEPYMASQGRYDIDIRVLYEKEAASQYSVLLNRAPCGESWRTTGSGVGWVTHTLRGVDVRNGDEIAVEVSGASARVDYLELRKRGS
jgi:hypothetical protein